MASKRLLDDAARRYIGVRWCRLGRSEHGLDCVGLVVLSARDCGIEIPDIPPYADEPQDTTLLDMLRQYGNEISPSLVQAGDIAVFQLGCYGGHLGIISDHPEYKVPSVIHAFAPRKQVIEEPLQGMSARIWRAFRVRDDVWPS